MKTSEDHLFFIKLIYKHTYVYTKNPQAVCRMIKENEK